MLAERRFSTVGGLAALACAVYAGGLVALQDRTFALTAFDDIGMIGFAAVAAVACASAARREVGRDASVMWLWCAVAALFVCGQSIWTWLQLSGGHALPFPSPAEVLFLGSVATAVAAACVMAGAGQNPFRRLSDLAEGVLAALSLLFIAWLTFLGPAFRSQETAGALSHAIALAYPLGMGAAVAILIVVVARRGRSVDARLLLITAHVAWMTVVNVGYAWYVSTGRYSTGDLFDVAWPIAFSILTVAALAPTRRAQTREPTATRAIAQEGAPFVLTFAALVVAAVHLSRGREFTKFELWLGLTIILFMLVRHALGLAESLRLNRGLEEKVLLRTAELQASRESYRAVIDGLSEIIFVLRGDGRVQFLNSAFTTVTGIPLADALDKPVFSLVHPDDRAFAAQQSDRLLASGDHDPVEIRLVAADGSTRWVDVRGQAQRDDDGRITGFSGTMVDVTVRRRAEASVRESEERFRLLLDSSGEGIFGVDLDNHCTFINAAASAMLGLRPGALLGRSVHDAIHHSRPDGTPYPFAECPVAATLRDGVPSRSDDDCLWRADGTQFPAEFTSHPILENGAITGAVVTFTNITARRAAQDEIRHRSLHDGLTGLPNRTQLVERLEQTVRGMLRDGGEDYAALLIMDLDRFKDINDTFGHPVGDVVLQEIAQRMSGPGVLRDDDTVGRLGGDEFAVVVTGLSAVEEAMTVAEKLAEAVSRPIYVDGHQFQVGCSIGIAMAPLHGTESTVLLQRADVAMYVAKAGEERVAVYTSAADTARLERLDLITQLRAGIDGDQLVLHYQPITDMRSGSLARLEALCRWDHPSRGLMWPDSFISLAEQAGIIMPLTTWALRDALRQSRLWRSEGIVVPIAVNISAQTLHDPRLPAAVEEWFLGPAPAGPLELEITESAVVSDPDAAVAVLTRLVALGVRVAIDDFGTGYSSLAQLKRLPVHAVKIDKSFVAEMHTDRRDASIVQTVIRLSHTLGLEVVAEGVESQRSAEYLSRLGCDFGQGWHYGEPQAAADVTSLLLAAQDVTTNGPFDAL